MKNFIQIITLGLFVFLAACNSGSQPVAVEGNKSFFGKKISADNAVTMPQLTQKMKGKKEGANKVKGEIEAVCKMKGCWMTLKNGDKPMRVTFKDYGFFVPKDASGKMATVEGIAKLDTTSVEILRHYAEDEGLSKEEIAKITEPEIELVFVADGVIIED